MGDQLNARLGEGRDEAIGISKQEIKKIRVERWIDVCLGRDISASAD